MKRSKQSSARPSFSLPDIDYKGKDARAIALQAARLCLFPDEETAGQFKRAIFPTRRKMALRGSLILDESNKEIGMYDDNTTPRWALLWSHNIQGGDEALQGWRVAHVWNDCNNVQCYTRLENLLLVPAAYAGLTDDDGPLAPYLRYHVYEHYKWCPEPTQNPYLPADYDMFRNKWKYLPHATDPANNLVFNRLQESKSRRAEVLREFIRNAHYWDQPIGKA
jgi:hypothetical protein